MLPNDAAAGPEITSTRSNASVGRSAHGAMPVVGEPIRMPSMNTATWLADEPRMLTDADEPGPPFCATVTPGSVASACVMLGSAGDSRSRSSRVSTCVDA